MVNMLICTTKVCQLIVNFLVINSDSIFNDLRVELRHRVVSFTSTEQVCSLT